MRFGKATSVLVLCFMSAFCASAAVVDENVEAELRSNYLNKVLTLRHSYKGEQLSFAQDGSLIGKADAGPWTVYGQVLVGSIELRPHSVQITGRRVLLIFDDNANGLIDLVEHLERTSQKGKKHRDKPGKSAREETKSDYLHDRVEIAVALPSENPSEQEVSSALAGVFVKPGESLTNVVPDCWRDYLDRIEGRPPRAPVFSETVYRVERGRVTPPRPVSSPDPEFADEARSAGYQGQVTLGVVVDATGKPNDVQILRPLGLGLDEKAVEAVRKWRFEPATKEKQPVAVKIAVEVEFHL